MKILNISGSTPSKKNSRRPYVRGGRIMNFPSKDYMAWEKDALKQLMGTQPVTNYPTGITMVFYMKDNRGRDLDNMSSSVLDMLQKANIIESDDWQHIDTLTLQAGGVDKLKPRVQVFIDE